MNNKKYPLTKTEYGIYFDFASNPKGTAYNIPQFLTFDKDTDVLKLKEAVEKAVEAHPYLRTRLSIDENGNVYKSICDEPVNVEIKEIRDAEFNKSDYVYPFDLLKDCLCRFCVFRTESAVVLFCDIHHIIFDGFSLQLFMADIDRALSGQQLEVETYTGNDVSEEEAQRLLTPELDEAKNYYNSVFGGLELESVPINDKNDGKPVAKKFRYDFTLFNADDIKNFAHSHGIKSSTFFTGVFGMVLSKFSGAEESLFSTIYNARNKKLARSCGMFVKTLPVYCNSKKNDDIEQYLKEIDVQLDSNRKYDLYSYADICADMQISPKSLFAYQGNAWQSVNFGGKQIIIETIPSPDAKSSLTVEVFRLNGKFFATVEYRSDLYEEESMQMFIRCYEQTVSEFLSKQKLSEVDITDSEQLALIDGFNQTETVYDTSKTVVDLFREQAQANPENTAVVYLDKRYTYKEVDEISDKISGYISSLGIGREDVVSILIPRCEYMVIASLGALKSGAAYQPLDPSYPSERLEFMIKDASAKLLIADKSLLDRVPNYKGKVLLLDDIPTLPECDKLPESPKPEDLFIMLYTSGSTGIPKGCMLEHRNIASFCNWFRNYYNLTQQSKVAAYASYGFDANMMDTYPTLTSGAALHIIDESIRLDLIAIEKYFNENEITHSFMTTQVGRQFALESNCKTLKYLSVGGEKLVPTNTETNFKFTNLYGPTECTVCVTAFTVDKDYDRVPIGKALDNTKLYVVDKYGKMLPPCVPGELWISGYGVSRGYLNRPEQNEKTFIKNPFTDEKGYERIYRTGDIVRYLPNGNIDFVGRNDGQVKIRGFRIELSEVEKVIREYDGIKDATVIARKLSTGGQSINAYITADTKIDISKLNEFIESRKPPYMVPASTMQIDVIPLTVNGKVNKRALPEPEIQLEGEIVPPQNEIQQRIFDCISQVTGSDKFGITTDIFYAGVTSIGAIKLNVLLSKEFNAVIKTSELKENNTVEKLEKFLSVSQKIEKYDILPDYPITQTQNGIFIECSANENTTMYNIPSLFKLSDKVDIDRLKTAVENTINAHPYIKTRLFMNDSGDVRAKRNDSEKSLVELIECDELPETSELVKPFELLGGNLYRAKIYKTNSANYLLLELHHIIGDGTSMAVIVDDINNAYNGKTIEKETYTGFETALDEEKARKTDEYEKAKKYYDSIFGGCDTDFLPIKDKNDTVPSVNSCEIECDLSVESVKHFCDENNITLNAFFNGVFGFVLAKYNCKDEAIYTTVYNGRNDSRLSRAVTMLVKTFPVLFNANGEKKIVDLLTETKNQLMNSMSNDLYSFAEISRAYDIKADIMFVYQGDSFVFDTIAGEKAEMQILSLDTAKAPITINVYIKNNKIVFDCEYRSDMYEESTIMGMAQCLSLVSEEFLGKTYLKDVSVLTDESKALVDSFNKTEKAYDTSKTVVDLFREQAKANPDNTAVVYLDKRYTYKQVDEISDKIGGYISSLGIGKEDVVSILIPRCEYMVIASMGALKSGAAYQPLDPSYPSERLEFMIKDADAKLLIADKSLLDRVPNYNGKVLLLDDIPTLPECDKLPESPKPEDLFIMLYTSGSTGIPKGCMLEHRNIASFCNWFRNYYNLTPQSKVVAYASYGFDANMMDTYPTLTSGAELHIIDEAIRLDLMAIEKYFNENEITHSFMTTQVGRQFAIESNCKTLKYLSVGGEKLVPTNTETNFKFTNLYGPTECTVCVTAFTVDKDYDRVPIGKALDNTKLYVVDKYGKMLPPCVPGELWISGYGVSRGYLNRPEQNEKVFIKNPFTDEKGYERIYRTGDIVRYLPNGNIDFVGRNDGQVKIRGFRIELSEVEKVIREYDGIKDAAVIARKLSSGGQTINAYITADTKIDISKLNEFIESRKPYYMIPESTVQIDVIPLTVNGKVDKRKLLEIKPVAKSENKTDIPSKPLTMLEKKISEIVEKIIGHNEFSISDDLMHTGMNSLSVIKLAVALNKQFGYEANVKNMMKGCSVVSIENDLQEYLLSGSFLKPSQPVQEQKTHKAQYPLSKTQLGVYLDCMKNPYGTLYNIPSILKFPKNINAEKLADSVKKVILAHPYIFTHITTQNDDVEQVYKENPTFDLTVEKLTESQFAQLKKDFVQPYSLVKAPLFRIKVVETEKNVYLVTDFHHIVFDGGSLNIFMTQLKEVYEGGEIKPEEYTYFDYVENEVNAENGEEYKTAEKFFDDMLKNFESSSEITPDLSGIMENGKCAEAVIPFEMSAFESFCNDNGFTPAQLFLAGTFYALSRFVNSRNVYLSTISNGRSDMRLTDCFGMFVKTLPIGIEVDDISSLEFVNRTKSVFTGAIENEIYPYAKICAKFGYAPNIMYEYQLGVTDNLTIDGNPVEKNYFEAEKTKFKASVCIESHDNKPCVVVRYNDALYSKELMQTLARSILNSTKHIVENPSGKIRNVSMLDDEQIKELKGFSSTLLAPVENEVLHKIFEKQAEKTPDRKAIVACDRTLTYSELDRLANITANELIARGFKKGGKAVVLLSRTSKIFTTIFGILKAGGAFIPTCPDYPKERIESIIEDSEADFVITEGELLDVYDKTTDVDTLLSGRNSEIPNVEVSPEDLAYLIYTSGSTGKPKGVMLRHKGISNYITYSDANIHVKNIVDNCTAYGSVTTVSFDMSLKETVLSLCNGLTLVFASDEQTTNPVLLAQFLKENNVDVFNSTPSRLLQYMELDEFVEAMKNCKVILSGGEKYPDKLLKLLREKTEAKILNTYGPTEITVSSNCKDLTNACEISIGKPLMNYIEHIVDTDGNLIPVGVVGELLISGCGVALGYNKLPQQTEKAFIEYNGERTYRSGDYAKWTKNGDVIILGRTDNQVKLRGLRIELGEIEKCLSNISGIKSAVALIRKVNKADAICAYYTAETQLDEEYIRNELKKTLTDYMIPTAYVQLDSMPLTPNGKINTKLLPEPVVADKNGGLEPSTQLERKLCDIFAKVLELDKVYADDNFFDIGGSSLTVTRVIILANKADIEISYGDVFANPTPKSLAKLLDKDNTNDEFDDLSKFDYTDIDNLLKNNNLDSFKNGEMQEIGDVLLTGAAGFLGIHILYELIHKYSGKIYCMLRDKNNNPAENRLNTVFYYYFETSLKEKYSDRVTVLNGDVTDRKSFDKFLQYKIDTVINCAANVKHFSKGTDIEDVNLYGALNVIDFCKQANARLIHVSTMSVGGIFAGKQGEVDHLEETQLYFGQQESSKYTMSKFLAERAILDEVSKGFNAKIMRVGTLAARNSDGEYQINFTTNTFMGRLKSNLIIGKYPYDMIEMPFELSPIDFVAKAILLLAQTPKECTVFHPFNNHTLMMGDLYMEMDKIGLHSEPSENEEYEQALENAKQNPEKAKILSSMIAYQNMAHGQKIFVVSKSNKYTMQVLYRMGFRWPVTSLDYMKRFIQALKGLGFFDFE